MEQANNIFINGLNTDLHPLTTSENLLVDALNATTITFNGNEFVRDYTEKIREIVEIFENSQISRMDVEQDLFKIRLEKKEVITVSNAVVTEKRKKNQRKRH